METLAYFLVQHLVQYINSLRVNNIHTISSEYEFSRWAPNTSTWPPYRIIIKFFIRLLNSSPVGSSIPLLRIVLSSWDLLTVISSDNNLWTHFSGKVDTVPDDHHNGSAIQIVWSPILHPGRFTILLCSDRVWVVGGEIDPSYFFHRTFFLKRTSIRCLSIFLFFL